MKSAGLFGLEMLEVTRRQEVELEEAELKDEEQEHQRDDTGWMFGDTERPDPDGLDMCRGRTEDMLVEGS